MQKGRVVGTVTSTVKHHSMSGQKLLLIQPEGATGNQDGYPVLAIDPVGAGKGEQVIISSDGRYARDFLSADATPVRWTVIGICDP